MQYHVILCNTMQYHAIPRNTTQYHAIPCNTKQCHAKQCNNLQNHSISCNTMQYHAIPCNTTQNNAKQCNNMQYHAIPCNIMQYHAIPCFINICWRSIPPTCGQYKAFLQYIWEVLGRCSTNLKRKFRWFLPLGVEPPPLPILSQISRHLFTPIFCHLQLYPTNMRRTLHFQDINFKSSFNWFRIDIHQQLRPLTANYLVIYKVISSTISLVHNI